jgi:protein-tyrosine phosphatase
MIDLHSHILPGVDDGSPNLETSIKMAKIAENDGIEVMACTPHFMPGLYDNQSDDIRQRVSHLNEVFEMQGIKLALVVGADAHIRPDFLNCLRSGSILTLHDSRYVLFEPPHALMPKGMADLLFNVQMTGYVPILTHPERYSWIEQNYKVFEELAHSGVWMQITASSLTGRFGGRAQYWGQRMLAEGLVSIIATDAHNTASRPPLLSDARKFAQDEVGTEEATNLVVTRPLAVLENWQETSVPSRLVPVKTDQKKKSFFSRLLRGS